MSLVVDKDFPVILYPRQSNYGGGYSKGCIVWHDFHQKSQVRKITCFFYIIHPIHAAAMFNRRRGLEGKYAQHYVNREVT